MVVEYRLCNVLLADGTRSEEYPQLYVRKSHPVHAHEDGSVTLGETDYIKYDFATYLNAFSNIKWRTYTVIDNVRLRLVASGTFDVTLVAYAKTQGLPRREVLAPQHVEQATLEAIDFTFPNTQEPLLAFEIVAKGPVDIREAYYFTCIDDALIREVELAVATTTFHKEEFVVPNIHLFEQKVLGCDEPVAKHFTLHVVDNGRTLDVAPLEGERVHVYPNPNVGGAGGFARGMIAGMEQDPKATHVLLMDDDVQIHPEAIKRTFNLLSLVNDEYSSAIVSGAMLGLERPTEFHEDVGHVDGYGFFGAAKLPHKEYSEIDVSEMEQVMALETEEVHVTNMYAAWWYCCIPMPIIEEKGLSLPLFIRGDDAEYGNRSGCKFMTMNGICIWHLMSAGIYRATLERYYPIRNFFIAQAASGIYKNVNMLDSLNFYFRSDLKAFNYDAAELCLMGFEDFLRGPEHLKRIKTDELNQQIWAKNEQLKPISELDQPIVTNVNLNVGVWFPKQERDTMNKAYDLLTFNGQRGPSQLASGGVAVIPYVGWYFPTNEIRGKDVLVCVTQDGTQGVIRRKDRVRFNELLKRYKGLLKEYDKRRDEINAQWAAAQRELTSVEFWKRYLEYQDQ